MASKTKLKKREHGSGTIVKDGKRFYLRVMINGKYITKMLRLENGTPCTRREDAETAADALRPILSAHSKEKIAVQVAVAKKLQKRSGLTLQDAWTTYLKQPNRPDSAAATLKNHQGAFSIFHRWIEDKHPEIKRVAEIDKELAKDYFSYFWARGISAKRYNDMILSLRLIFRHLSDSAALEFNPFDSIVKKEVEINSRKEFTQDQIKAIFAGFSEGFFYKTICEELGEGRIRVRKEKLVEFKPMNQDELKVLLNLCCWTGCRGQDGCLMQWKNIDFYKNIISYIPRKTARRTQHKVVTLPLHSDLQNALKIALKWQSENVSGEDYILPKTAKRYKYNPSGIQKDVMKIIQCATGLETTAKEFFGRRKLAANAYSLHSFRHSFVSFCANAGVPLAVVAEIIGHGNPAMTRHYSHITTESKQVAIETLPQLQSFDQNSEVIEAEIIYSKDKLKFLIENLDEAEINRVIDYIYEVKNGNKKL